MLPSLRTRVLHPTQAAEAPEPASKPATRAASNRNLRTVGSALTVAAPRTPTITVTTTRIVPPRAAQVASIQSPVLVPEFQWSGIQGPNFIIPRTCQRPQMYVHANGKGEVDRYCRVAPIETTEPKRRHYKCIHCSCEWDGSFCRP